MIKQRHKKSSFNNQISHPVAAMLQVQNIAVWDEEAGEAIALRKFG